MADSYQESESRLNVPNNCVLLDGIEGRSGGVSCEE